MGAIEEYASKCYVKVTKSDNDGRILLCGEPVQIDEQGKEFFIVPAHQAAYLKTACPGWTISEEFVIDLDPPKK